MLHFLWECNVTITFIGRAFRIIQEIVPYKIEDSRITRENFIFNTIHTNHGNIIHCITTKMKMYLYNSRCAMQLPNEEEF